MATSLTEMLVLKKELTTGEVVTGLTAGALIFSVVYNLGYFSFLHTSFVSLLTPQDLLVGAAVTVVPTAFVLELGFRFDRWTRQGEGWGRKLVATVLIVALTAAMVISSVVLDNAAITTFLFATMNALIAIGFILDLVSKTTRGIFYASIAGIIWTVVYQFGVGYFEASISGYTVPEFELVMADQTVQGRIIRETASYTFVFDGSSVTMFPNTSIGSLKKLKVEK